MHNWIPLLYSRNEYNIANQLYFNNTNFLKKKLFVEGWGKDELGIWDYQMQTIIYTGKHSSETSYKYEP